MQNKENRNYIIGDITGEKHIFIGRHLPDREKPNWHYYATEDGRILHFRKCHMVFVSEKLTEKIIENQQKTE